MSIALPTLEEAVRSAVAGVDDPEYPGVSIVDLGLLEQVRVDHGHVEVGLIPTFSGCPALAVIADEVRGAVGDVEGVCLGAPSSRRNCFSRRRCGIALEVSHSHERTDAGVGLGNCPADAIGTAGNDGYLAVEPEFSEWVRGHDRSPYLITWMRLRSVPITSASISTTSPCFINTGGLRANPTPCGVPVETTSPGSSVK